MLHRSGAQSCLSPPQQARLRSAYAKTHAAYGGTRRPSSAAAGAAAGSAADAKHLLLSHYACDTEYCRVKEAPGLSAEAKAAMLKRFRPPQPAAWRKKGTEWLDSNNIADVLAQYEAAMPDFSFIGPVPIDFDKPEGGWGKCVVDELCRIDLHAAAKKGIKHIGIVFNLDPHDKPGSHWVCAYVDLPQAAAYYFDSYGMAPPREVDALLRRFKEQGVKTVLYNDLRAQYKDTECGMYCLMVLICLLRGRSFQSVCAMRVSDAVVNAFRDVLFATERPRGAALTEALPLLCK